MAYREGNIAPTADPAAALITQIEGTLNDHTGQWEFVEEVVISTIPYRVWHNRGTGVTNPNSFGSDFYIIMYRNNATTVRFKTFEHWDATNKKVIRPVKGVNAPGAPNANSSFGDETNGYTVDSTTVNYSGFSSLPTTGIDYFIRATKDQLNVTLKYGTTDEHMHMGLFESLLTASPSEPFPLFMSRGTDTNMNTSSCGGGFSRFPSVTTAQTNNFQMYNIITPLQPMVGGIGSAVVDKLHGDSVLIGRPSVQHFGIQPEILGQWRGQMYDIVVLAQPGSGIRNGDYVTLGADVYYRSFGTGPSSTLWIKRDAT